MHDSSIVDGRMPRFRLPHHLEHECAGNVRICRNKNWAEKECEAKVLAKDWEFHQTGSRAAAAQPIQSDDSDVKPCPHRLEQCDKCKGMVPKSDLEDHKKTACTKNKVRCENLGCKEEVVQAGLAYHKKNCLYRKVKAHQGIGSKHGSTKSVNHRPGVKQHPGYYDFTWEGSAQFGPFGGKRNRYHQNRCTSCDKDVGKPANLFKEPGCKQATCFEWKPLIMTLYSTLYIQAVPGKPAAEVSYKNKMTYRSVPVLSTMRVPRVPQPDACAPDF